MPTRVSIVIASIALLVAGTGTAAGESAVAAVKRLITGADIRDGSVTTRDVRDRSLRARDLARGQLPRGPAGPAGQAGLNGLNGQTGAAGASGAPGSPGVPGAPGETGATGPIGPAGDAGATGQPGPTGPMGPQGQPGVTAAYRRFDTAVPGCELRNDHLVFHACQALSPGAYASFAAIFVTNTSGVARTVTCALSTAGGSWASVSMAVPDGQTRTIVVHGTGTAGAGEHLAFHCSAAGDALSAENAGPFRSPQIVSLKMDAVHVGSAP